MIKLRSHPVVNAARAAKKDDGTHDKYRLPSPIRTEKLTLHGGSKTVSL